ncbi:dihydrofolate reductase, partial [Klebsiella pneumoniae]|nr:dihydrofolate reductase [Klebsiella pneumoniae]
MTRIRRCPLRLRSDRVPGSSFHQAAGGSMKVVAIAAVADNGVIGSGQEMLWHISEDFRRFKTVTM